MSKRREPGIRMVASMPWSFGLVIGIVGFWGIRYGIGWYLSGRDNPVLASMGKQFSNGGLAPLAWVFMLACWGAALVSYLKQGQRRRLLDEQTGMESLRAIDWRSFEMLVGEAFRRQGYSVKETGLGGPDGGIDIVLTKDGKTILVQCKQWRNRQVNVKVVREMYGLLAHHGAAAVKIVSTGSYTPDAERFAQGKPIELIRGEELLAMVRAVQAAGRPSPADSRTRPDRTQHDRRTQSGRIQPEQARPSTAPAAAVASTPVPRPAPTLAQASASDPASAPASASASTVVAPTETPLCPQCGQVMIRRFNRATKQAFWGCTAYPQCRGTRTG